ncbi:protein TPX2 [Arabidopsis lyrata subsp. lyrata]|uniref:protein TPX2 n=1 Tax=Arabidopsis lyrata subsp. lyrata TaxID=81972 RepID=UPI000A29CA30|nr:protein TPX2 [Arabidopsis lyrata subsp. lyrata]|eukprot:XP_020879376.1 protein TPX2 [Arabidopsis lyrata subsp. lyrata]
MQVSVSRLDQTPFVHKVSRKGFKITVPKEPNLKTAQRAARNRFKAQSAPEQIAKFSSTVNKAVQETSSASLPKKNTPRPQDFQTFHLRTSLRERERSSSAKIAPTDNSKHSLTSSPLDPKMEGKLRHLAAQSPIVKFRNLRFAL